MARKWIHQYDNEHTHDRMGRRIEKIRKEKRSERGRTTDDWLIDNPEENLSEEEMQQKIDTCLASGYRFGRVVEAHKRHIFVAEESKEGVPDTGLLWLCTVARRHFQRAHKERNFVVVGDRILFQPDANLSFDDAGEPLDTDLPRGAIQHAFARKTRICRKDPLHPEWEHVMLANIDCLVVVASVLNPEVRWGLVDRYLVQAEREELPVVLVLNKVDLLDNTSLATPAFLATYRRRVQIYKDLGYDVFEVCALKPRKTLDEIKRLRRYVKGKIIGFSGHSGVGKSSLLNLMGPEQEQWVDENPEIFYKGRHTTTFNTLLTLDVGAYAIDTPGIRSFDITTDDPLVLSWCFREFRGKSCKYRECRHDQEPQCGVKDALAKGEISPERYRSYMGLLKGVSLREGGNQDTGMSDLLADLGARTQHRDAQLAEMEKEENEPQPAADAPSQPPKKGSFFKRSRTLGKPRSE